MLSPALLQALRSESCLCDAHVSSALRSALTHTAEVRGLLARSPDFRGDQKQKVFGIWKQWKARLREGVLWGLKTQLRSGVWPGRQVAALRLHGHGRRGEGRRAARRGQCG